MSSSPPEPEEGPHVPRRGEHYFLKLWLIVSAFWTAATLLRVARLWVPIEGWPAILGGPWMWLELVIPPVMVGVVIFAVRQIGKTRNHPCISPSWCRQKS
jgi:hypothetical protein